MSVAYVRIGLEEIGHRMISYVRGPGGFWSRFGAEAVPFWVGAVVFAVFVAFVSIPVALGVLLLAWVTTSAMLRWVRRRPRLRRVYRLALGLHIFSWTLLGILHSHLEPPGALGQPTVHDWGRALPVRVGVGSARFALPARTTLAGWGQVPRRLRASPFGGLGVVGRAGQAFMGGPDQDGAPRFPLFRTADNVLDHDVGAHALVVIPEGAEDAAPLAFVTMDLVTMERSVVEAILKELVPLGYLAETLIVSATHTHSGPGGYSHQPLSVMAGTDHFDAPVFQAIVDAGVQAVRAAHEQSVAGSVSYAMTRDRSAATGLPTLARNRRKVDENEIDDRVYHLRVLPAPAQAHNPRGVLVNYAVHPILKRRRSTNFSPDLIADLRGGLGDLMSFDRPRLPPPDLRVEMLFVNGAAGDISPRHYDGPREARGKALAAAFAEASAPDSWLVSGQPGLRLRAARVTRDFGAPYAVFGVGDRGNMIEAAEDGVFGGGFGGFVADLITLPINAVIWSTGITEARVAFRFSGGAAAIANLEMAVTGNEHAFGAIVLTFPADDAGAEPAHVNILWAPAEATQALGKRWRREIADGLFLGYTNGVMSYVVTEAEYDIDSYEARSTLYGRGTAGMVGAALKAAHAAAK